MNRILKIALVALVAAPLFASAEEAAAEPEKKGPTVTFSGMVDSYYTVNLDQPQSYVSPTAGAGGYTSEPGFNLNFAKITAVAEADRAGFRLDVGLAKEGAAIGSAYPGFAAQDAVFPTFVQQAYASYKFDKFTLEAGRFVTPAGFEVFEAKDNWTYSKGLLFNFAVPTAHEGARVSVPLGALTATAYVANGSDLWTNDIGFSKSPYKTGILNLVYAKDATTVAVTGFYSYIPTALTSGATGKKAWQVDAVVTQGFGPLAVNVSGDYVDVDGSKIYAVAGNAKFDLSPVLAVVGRVEYLQDKDGIRIATPVADTKFTSYTAGINFAVGEHAALKGEVRYDTSTEDFFGAAANEKSIGTATIGAIAWF